MTDGSNVGTLVGTGNGSAAGVTIGTIDDFDIGVFVGVEAGTDGILVGIATAALRARMMART